MIFSTNQNWKDLERSTKISFLLVVLIYLMVSMVGYFKPGPTDKDRQVYAWASSTVEIGLMETRGYNLSNKGILTGTSWRGCQAYVMAPPLYHLVLAGIFSISGQHWRSLRIGTILYGLIFLYACLALAVKFFQGKQRSWLLFFALTPMVLIFSVWTDTNCTPMGFLIISYLCLTNFLETGKLRHGIWSGAFYVLAFWHSYISISIVPAMLIQLMFHPGLTYRERRFGFGIFAGFVAFGGLISLAHIFALPGSMEWFFNRLAERFSDNVPEVLGGGTYTLLNFFIKQAIRLTTHYTPISIILVSWAFIIAFVKVIRRKVLANKPNGHVAVDPLIALIVFFSWGVPMQLGIQVAYIHPLMLYYFIAFFTFGSVIGLDLLTNNIKSSFLRQFFVTSVLILFLSMSIARSIYNFKGGSLYDIWHGVNTEKGELLTIEELREYTCKELHLK